MSDEDLLKLLSDFRETAQNITRIACVLAFVAALFAWNNHLPAFWYALAFFAGAGAMSGLVWSGMSHAVKLGSQP